MVSTLNSQPYQQGNERAILELFHLCFPGRDLSEAVWAWRFRDNPAGHGVIELMWDGNILAAHYGIIPVRLRFNNQDWLTGLSIMTMTHPNYRGRNLFSILGRNAYERAGHDGLALVWGFPNPLIHRNRIRDLAWMDIYEVPMLRLPLAGKLSLPVPSDHMVELSEFDHRFDQFWEQVKNDNPIVTQRGQKYLQWRYVRNLHQQYRILAYVESEAIRGYAVLKRYRSEIQIVDILTVQEFEVGVQLISRAAQIAAADSAVSLSLWLNITHPLHRELEKYGFRNGEPVTYFGARVLQPELQNVGIYEFRNWYLTMGDSDVF
jgi:GNAT superfamily N-acetyltransferase